jgi:hypothetical protein
VTQSHRRLNQFCCNAAKLDLILSGFVDSLAAAAILFAPHNNGRLRPPVREKWPPLGIKEAA